MNRQIKTLACTLVLVVLSQGGSKASAEELGRRGMIGVMLGRIDDETKERLKLASAQGVLITSIIPDSAAAEAGLKGDDVITKVGDQPTDSLVVLQQAMRKYYGGDAVPLTILREGATQTMSITLRPRPKENWTEFEVVYSSAGAPGKRVRTILSKPKTEGKHPAVMLMFPPDANSVERAQPTPDPLRMLISGLTTAGFVTMRVDRPGVGDSEGTDSDATTTDMDIEAYRAALASLKGMDFVDPKGIFVFGHSTSSALLPSVAQGSGAAGVVSFAAVFRPWYESVAESLTRRWELELIPADDVKKNAAKASQFMKAVYVEKKSHKELFDADPELKKLMESFVSNDRVFGMHYKYGQQLAGLHVKSAWEKLDVPLLAVWGTSDYVSSREDSESMVAAVNAAKPGTAIFMPLSGVDHYLGKAADKEESFLSGFSPFNPVFVETLIKWMREKKPT